MEIDPRSVRAFVQIAGDLSFTQAAARLNVSQPQLSMRIRTLEARLGFRLFERTSRKVALTPQGERLLDYANRLIVHSDALNQVVDVIRSDAANSLKIATVDFARTIRRRIFSRFMATYPGIAIDVDVIRRTQEGYEGLSARRWDLGILLEIELAPAETAFETQVLARLPVGMLLPANSSLAARSTIDAAALRGLDVAIFRRDVAPALHDRMTQLLAPLDVRITRLPEATEEGLKEFVRQSGVMAMCGRWWDAADDAPEGVVHRPITDHTFQLSYVLARPREGASKSSNSMWATAREISAETGALQPLSRDRDDP